MADVSDVETAFVNQIETIIYPNGTDNPSIINKPVRIYRGNPIPKNVDTDLASGIININVAAIIGMYKSVTQFMRVWENFALPSQSLIATVAGNLITLTGIITLPQTVMTIVNGVNYAYVVQLSDTLDSIATAIAALLPNATAAGAVVTVNNHPYELIARVGGFGKSYLSVDRQEQIFAINVRGTTDDAGYIIRDQLCKILRARLSYLILLALPDGSKGNISCSNDMYTDYMQKEKMLMRTLRYAVIYETTITEQDPIITAVEPVLTVQYDI